MKTDEITRLLRLAEHTMRHEVIGQPAARAKLPALMANRALGIAARYVARGDKAQDHTAKLGDFERVAIRRGVFDGDQELPDSLEKALETELLITNPKFLTES